MSIGAASEGLSPEHVCSGVLRRSHARGTVPGTCLFWRSPSEPCPRDCPWDMSVLALSVGAVSEGLSLGNVPYGQVPPALLLRLLRDVRESSPCRMRTRGTIATIRRLPSTHGPPRPLRPPGVRQLSRHRPRRRPSEHRPRRLRPHCGRVRHRRRREPLRLAAARVLLTRQSLPPRRRVSSRAPVGRDAPA